MIDDLKTYDIDFNHLSPHRLKDRAIESYLVDTRLSYKLDIACDVKELLIDKNESLDRKENIETMLRMYLEQ